MDEEFSSTLLTGCVLLALDVGLYPARPAERARRMPISLPQKASLAAHRLRRMILACTRPLLVGHTVELATAQPPPTTTARSNRHLGWPSTTCASFEHEAPTQTDDEPGMDAADDHADPGHPSRTAACPTAALQDLTSAGHSGRGNAQTPDAHTGRRHRTPDSGQLDAGQRTPGRSDTRTGHSTSAPWTGKRGQWSLAPDTGHWTSAEDVDRLTKARPASGPPGPPRRATARWDAQPCSCGRRLRRSAAHAGPAVRPPSSAR